MSTQTVKICDIKDCNFVADTTLPYMMVANFNICQEDMDNSDGLHIWTEKNVDLCGKHYYQYRRALPNMILDQMDAIKRIKR